MSCDKIRHYWHCRQLSLYIYMPKRRNTMNGIILTSTRLENLVIEKEFCPSQSTSSQAVSILVSVRQLWFWKGRIYEDILIKESIVEDHIIDYLSANKVELRRTGRKPCYWTALFSISEHQDIPSVSPKSCFLKKTQTGLSTSNAATKNALYSAAKSCPTPSTTPKKKKPYVQNAGKWGLIRKCAGESKWF